MTDYTKLTEQEINEAVALIKKPALKGQEFIKIDHESVSMASENHAVVIEQTPRANILKEWFIYDPCNNPTDWAPLLEELQRMGQVKIEGCTIQFEDTINEKPELDIFIGRTKSLGKRVCILWLMVKEVGNE